MVLEHQEGVLEGVHQGRGEVVGFLVAVEALDQEGGAERDTVDDGGALDLAGEDLLDSDCDSLQLGDGDRLSAKLHPDHERNIADAVYRPSTSACAVITSTISARRESERAAGKRLRTSVT